MVGVRALKVYKVYLPPVICPHLPRSVAVAGAVKPAVYYYVAADSYGLFGLYGGYGSFLLNCGCGNYLRAAAAVFLQGNFHRYVKAVFRFLGGGTVLH